MDEKNDQPRRNTYPHSPNIKQVAQRRSQDQLPDRLRDAWRSNVPCPNNFTQEHEQRILEAMREYMVLHRAKDHDAYIDAHLAELIRDIKDLADAAASLEQALKSLVENEAHFDAICALLQSAGLSMNKEAIDPRENPFADGGDHETVFWLINPLRDQRARGVYRILSALGREVEQRHRRPKGNPGKALITSFLMALLDVYEDATGLHPKRPDKGRALRYLLEINGHLPGDAKLNKDELTRRAREAAKLRSNRAPDK